MITNVKGSFARELKEIDTRSHVPCDRTGIANTYGEELEAAIAGKKYTTESRGVVCLVFEVTPKQFREDIRNRRHRDNLRAIVAQLPELEADMGAIAERIQQHEDAIADLESRQDATRQQMGHAKSAQELLVKDAPWSLRRRARELRSELENSPRLKTPRRLSLAAELKAVIAQCVAF